MGYEEFKEKILEKLRSFYGDNAEVKITEVQRNNGIHYDGLQIRMKKNCIKATPVIRLDELYVGYRTDGMDMEECVQTALITLKVNKAPDGVEQFAKRIKEWSFVRKKVFPILLSTEDNQELLQKLVTMPMLDLSVTYIIRTKMPDGRDGSIKISRKMMEFYGITAEQLHGQAMENLREDGYEFQDMDSIIQSLLTPEQSEGNPVGSTSDVEMHVLTNSCRMYGAAGILDRELLKRFAGDRDYVILPSSLHETIFVPVDGEYDKEAFDSMVAAVNRNEVSRGERLISHSYYYDARAGEIKMCA